MTIKKDEIQFKTFGFKVDDVQDDGMIRGYASTFGNVDSYGDIVDKGAFKRTIKASSGKIPILADHRAEDHIGWNYRMEEDDVGLKVEGQIDLNVQKGREKYSLAKTAQKLGVQMGLSIGFFTLNWGFDAADQNIRHLKEVKLVEYSIVTFPANTMASITSLKSAAHLNAVQKADQIELALQQWKRLGFSENEFKTALRNVFGPAKKTDDSIRMNHSIDSIKKILKGEV